ncbi:hypothetical protein EJV47_17510 [Hymenobacter gummosus]|uniref:Uncharacterized protein n=1 Tax=Hymenobacter gummosus TaxID=1776032 RepID=A0A431U0F2_9BACT|nr:hypothetical protein [Hymenobacter gummosus]RTQ48225.1 hypothetical protein EJV47_17510 [Hymenobacter gummosus]
MLHLNPATARQPPAARLQSVLAEGRLMDAADLLADWAQRQHAPQALSMEQQAHLLHSCFELLRRAPNLPADLWQQTRTCLQRLLPRA